MLVGSGDKPAGNECLDPRMVYYDLPSKHGRTPRTELNWVYCPIAKKGGNKLWEQWGSQEDDRRNYLEVWFGGG